MHIRPGMLLLKKNNSVLKILFKSNWLNKRTKEEGAGDGKCRSTRTWGTENFKEIFGGSFQPCPSSDFFYHKVLCKLIY